MADLSATTELDELYNASRQVRRRQEGQWLLNMAFFDSKQWCAYDGNRVFEPELEPYRVKLVDNRIRGIVGTSVAKMTKTRPQFVAVPDGTDDDSISGARLTERALDSKWGDLKISRKLRYALTWSRITGAAFWKEWWDAGQGDGTEILVYAQGHEQAGQAVRREGGGIMRAHEIDQLPEGYAEQVQPKKVAMGELCLELRNPFQMFPDALATEEGLVSCEHIIEEAVYSRQWLEDRYGHEQVKELTADSTSHSDIAARLPGMASSLLEDNGAPGNRGIRVREFWAPPCSKYADGKRVVWAQDKILHEGDNTYPWLPYSMFSGTPVPGRFWPAAPVTDLISPQTELNKRRSQIAENAERFGNPPLMRSSQNVDVEWHGLPGEELVFEDYGTPGAIPQFLIPPEMPGYVQTDIDRNENSFREISGQHEVSSGQVPTGVTAASAINLLQEQDDTRLGPDIGDMEDTIADAGTKLAWLMGHYYDDERMLRLAGPDGQWDIEAFRGGQMKGYHTIEVQSGSGLPQSKAAKQAAISSTLTLMVQNGMVPDQRTLRRVLREYEIGGLEAFFATIDHDEEQIQDEHRRAENGEPLELNSFDDDDLHVQGHEDFQKTSRYRTAVAKSPDFGAGFEAHVQAHRDRQAQSQLAQASAMQPQLPPGSPPPDVTQQPLQLGAGANGGAPALPTVG